MIVFTESPNLIEKMDMSRGSGGVIATDYSPYTRTQSPLGAHDAALTASPGMYTVQGPCYSE